MSVTLYTGNIYLKLKYIKEYFRNIKRDIIEDDYALIIREKIALNLKHELNNVLLRVIDEKNKLNYFSKSKNANKSDEYIIFKDKYEQDINKYVLNESGNCFDYIPFQGYYFSTLSKKEANFFLNINKINDANKYKEKFNEMMKDENKFDICDSSINIFKTIIEERPHCLK